MKFNSFLMFAVLFVAFFMFSTISSAQPLIEIELKVKGTAINRVPNFVEVITSNPRSAAAQLFAAGGVNLEEDTRGNCRFTVFHNKVLHIFHTVADYKSMLAGHTFKDGDVVYKYWLRSEAEEKDFVERFGLQVAKRDCRVGETAVTLYAATPGYFVICSGSRGAKTAPSDAAQKNILLEMERRYDAQLNAALRSYRASDTLGHAMILQKSKEQQTRYWRCQVVFSILNVWEDQLNIDEFHRNKKKGEEFSIPHCHLALDHLGISSPDEFFSEVERVRNRELYSWPEYLDPHSTSHQSFRDFLEESLSHEFDFP